MSAGRTGLFFGRMAIRLLTIAIALGVVIVGIAWMLKEPQGIVAVGTLLVCGAVLWAGFEIADGLRVDGDRPDEP